MVSLFKPPVQSTTTYLDHLDDLLDEQVPQFAPLEVNFQETDQEAIAVAPQLWELPCLLQLDFAELQAFEVVRDQYQSWGVEFDGAIALHPSHPAFANSEQPLGLMPLNDRLPITIYFDRPKQLVKAKLAGARQVTIRAFDAANRLIYKQHLGQSRYLYASPPLPPIRADHEVQIQAEAMVRVEICSEVPFILWDLICG